MTHEEEVYASLSPEDREGVRLMRGHVHPGFLDRLFNREPERCDTLVLTGRVARRFAAYRGWSSVSGVSLGGDEFERWLAER